MESLYQHVKHVNIVAETDHGGNFHGGICLVEFVLGNFYGRTVTESVLEHIWFHGMHLIV